MPEAITLGDIVSWVAFIAGALTSFGVIWKVISSVRAKQREKLLAEVQASVQDALKPIIERLNATENRLETGLSGLNQNNLQTARIDLMQAIEHTPQEHKAILDLGWHYFVKLKGDAWMSGVFRDWAKRENVDISYITARAAHLRD